ncbi:hypothetical protein EUGRSUZ_L02763 [Eucalyptus grandis]|uniref:Stress-response A/B barrel domain-containing protein n=1 Tax=Eucalyptus grandis TaxID=71139 RepID=A0AAD9WIC4_EUCGR|nr:hypothetical protein EUGRSUZ_L02763 [Eucalyptus grandis]
MEEAKGFVRRVLLLKFKAETAPNHVERLIKDYSNLVNLVESLKTWHMGKDANIKNLHEGFTHVVELTFEDDEGEAAYSAHPAHLEFHERAWPHVKKMVVIDYKPTSFHT